LHIVLVIIPFILFIFLEKIKSLYKDPKVLYNISAKQIQGRILDQVKEGSNKSKSINKLSSSHDTKEKFDPTIRKC
jgi:hypothetical protein